MSFKLSRKALNDFHLAFSFTMLFTAYNGQAHVQKTLTISIQQDNSDYRAEGYTIFGIIFSSFTLSMWLAPSAIALMGCRTSLFLGSLCYLSFVTFGYFENTWLTYAGGAMTGLGASLLWTSQATYCVLNSEIGNVYKSISVFWIFCEASEFSGNYFVYYLFKDPNQPVDRSVRNKIALVLAGFVLCSSAMLASLRKPIRSKEYNKENKPCSELNKAFKLLISRNMLFSSVIFMFCGLNLSFLNILPASLGFSKYLSSNSKEFAPLSGLMHGSGEIIGAVLALYMHGKFLIKLRLIPITCIYTMIAYIIICLGLPNTSVFTYTDERPLIEMSIYPFLLANIFMGMADACLHIEAYNFIGNLYPTDCAAPFAIFKFIRNIAVSSGSYCGNFLGLHIQMIILMIFSLSTLIIYHWTWEACNSAITEKKISNAQNCAKELP